MHCCRGVQMWNFSKDKMSPPHDPRLPRCFYPDFSILLSVREGFSANSIARSFKLKIRVLFQWTNIVVGTVFHKHNF